ncbi:MAG: hypothetical protein ABWY78_06185 [Microvirga sp.]
MPLIYENNAIRHPFRALRLIVRRWTLAGLRHRQLQYDANATHPATGDFDGGDIPAELQQFVVGEVLPWKGLKFKVGKVVGGQFPCVILVPAGLTHGMKLRALRHARDRMREDGHVAHSG